MSRDDRSTPSGGPGQPHQPTQPIAPGPAGQPPDQPTQPGPPIAPGPAGQPPDPVEAYLAAHVDALARGEEPPPPDDLDEAARAEVTELLGLLAADADADAGAGAGAGAPPGADIERRPPAESGFALTHRFVRPAPDVVVVGEAVRRARTDAGLTSRDVAAAMADRGSPVDAAALGTVEGSAAVRMAPREARLLAAVLDQPLAAIEASAEPWPADGGGLAALREAGADAVVLGDDVVVRTVRGDHLGVLRCRGDATLLDSRTYRQAAAALLTGPWSYLAGALLVAEAPPHRALAVDALDCVTRWHAPSGLSGFSRLADPEPVAGALASYDRTYAVHWTDPEPLTSNDADAGGSDPAGPAEGLAARLAAISSRLDDEARRARQPGKRPGYAAATRWLAGLAPEQLGRLLSELATVPADEARERFEGALAEEVAMP